MYVPSNYPDYMDATECKIIDGVIDRAIKAGLCISVYDGEEYALERSTDRAAIQREVAATDETRFVLSDPDSGMLHIGSVWFVHGNGEDVLSDYSWNHKLTDRNAEQIMAAICNTDA